MRHLIKFCTLVLLFLIKLVNAQNSNVTIWECATDISNSSSSQLNSQSTQNCSKTSSDWLTQYQFIDNYIPNAASFEAIKTIPINIVVFGEDDGSLFPFHIGQDMPNMASYFDPSGVEIPNPYITSSANVNFFEGWLNLANVNTAAPSGNGIPLLAATSPLSYQVLPSRLNTLTRVPAGNAVVSLKKAVVPSTLNSASCS